MQHDASIQHPTPGTFEIWEVQTCPNRSWYPKIRWLLWSMDQEIKKSWEIFKRYQELASNSLHSRTGEPELIGTQEIHLGAPSLGKTPCWREYSTRQAAILSFRHVGRQLTLNRNIRQMRFLPCGAQLMLVGLYEKKQTAQLDMYNPIPSGKLPFSSMMFLLKILLCFRSQVSLPAGIFLW